MTERKPVNFTIKDTVYDRGEIAIRSYQSLRNEGTIVIRTMPPADELPEPWWVGLTDDQVVSLVDGICPYLPREKRVEMMRAIARSISEMDDE